ncbi:MAG TPA: helix-turn-helix domain-containing protein [Terriglobales bacterium]|nr:helix-turn-helix domain-containing protein [Terriglobales bacterium]
MPPIADKHLEERILKAAQRLWRARGESGLTLRAVARQARTTTPTLYKRFRNKEALRLALAHRFRDELTAAVLSAPSLEQSHRRYLGYVDAHPREYELLGSYWGYFFSTPRPVRTWMLTQLAARLGGDPEQYSIIYEGIFLLCHGAATLVTSARDERVIEATRESCMRVCDKLIENASPDARERSA